MSAGPGKDPNVAEALRELLNAQGTSPIDPLLAAIIARLPAAGKEFPPAAREVWLQLMSMGFDLVYGGPAGGGMSSHQLRSPVDRSPAPKPAKVAPAKKAKPRSGRPPVPMPEFYIDQEGYARNERGDRVLANQVAGILTDFRGAEGDLGAIIWADDTRGVRGKRLDIHGAADPRTKPSS